MKKILFMGLILGIVATIAVATTSAMSAVNASTDDDEEKPTRQCSLGSQDDKNCENARANHEKHKDMTRDDKPNNDGGQDRALENLAYKSG
jgi:hypothetical protein